MDRGRAAYRKQALSVKNDAYGSYTHLPTTVMVKVLVLAGGADESHLRQLGGPQ